MKPILALALILAGQAPRPVDVKPGTPVTITVVPGQPATPSVSITLGQRIANVVPVRECLCHTGGGNVDVQQPSGDTLVITLTGVAVAVGTPCGPGHAALTFDVHQSFEVSFDKPEVKKAKLTLETRLIGLLRGGKKGAAGVAGSASLLSGPAEVLSIALPEQLVGGCDNLSVNLRENPVSVPIKPGAFVVHQQFHVHASHPRSILPCQGASAEFAPDPALDPLWISAFEPFHGAIKKDFGFQITIKVAPEEEKPQEKKPEKPGQ
jgi:hypothetical protein